MRVELDAFSGRPNPIWELTQQQSGELMALLQSLPPAKDAAKSPDGLGYRGFVVTLPALAAVRFGQLRVYRGLVFATGTNGDQAFVDAQHAMELWLLGTARGHIEQGAMDYIRKEAGLP